MKANSSNCVFVAEADLVNLVKAVYKNSSPQGLGFIYYQEGGLSDEVAKSMIDSDSLYPINLDYVAGRACKFSATKVEGGVECFHSFSWYDHSEGDILNVLKEVTHVNR
jgi:hypothetical protein